MTLFKIEINHKHTDKYPKTQTVVDVWAKDFETAKKKAISIQPKFIRDNVNYVDGAKFDQYGMGNGFCYFTDNKPY